MIYGVLKGILSVVLPLPLRSAPVLAAACALAVGVFVYHPGSEPKPVANTDDSQLFSDVYSMEQSLEPSATASVRVLFEEQQQ